MNSGEAAMFDVEATCVARVGFCHELQHITTRSHIFSYFYRVIFRTVGKYRKRLP